MTRAAAISVQNQFTKGLITEQSVINFPENAVTDADNCVFSELGPVTRRFGFDYEDDFEIVDYDDISDGTSADAAFVEFKWFFSTAEGTINFIVQQAGPQINFFQIASTQGLSSGRKTFSVNLETYKVSAASATDIRTTPCSFSSGKGYLFICHPFTEPLAIKYDQTSDDITIKEITVEIRDFEGEDDGLDTDERPSTLSNKHKYNLWNQGWNTVTRVNAGDISGGGSDDNVLGFWESKRTDYPSNADVFGLARGGSNNAVQEQLLGGGATYVGNTPAPRGHFVYNAFDVNRTLETSITGLTRTTSGSARPSCTAFYAGRIFYAGVSANGYSDKLYFSQIIESDKQLGRCYQANDPTSEKTFDLLDSDGGEILLPQIDKIVALHVVGDSLIILGTNGIFSVGGNDNGPFRATNYIVSLISTTGVLSGHSIVNTDGNLVWINSDALYTLSKDQAGVSFVVQNISKATIQTLLDDIPSQNKAFIKGSYNRANGIVQWLYSNDDTVTGYEYNRVLELNTISSAFYPYTIASSTPKVVGLISVSGQGISTTQDNVTMDDGTSVTTDSGDQVVIDLVSYVSGREIFKYATFGDIMADDSEGFTYSTISNTNYLDWETYDDTGKSYDSFFVTGYRIRGSILRPTQISPVEIVLKDLTDAEVIVHGLWDYGFRTTNPIYLYGPQRTIDAAKGWTRGSYRLRRVRFRGKGRSFQFKFESDGNKPFEVYGWSTFDTGGQQP